MDLRDVTFFSCVSAAPCRRRFASKRFLEAPGAVVASAILVAPAPSYRTSPRVGKIEVRSRIVNLIIRDAAWVALASERAASKVLEVVACNNPLNDVP